MSESDEEVADLDTKYEKCPEPVKTDKDKYCHFEKCLNCDLYFHARYVYYYSRGGCDYKEYKDRFFVGELNKSTGQREGYVCEECANAAGANHRSPKEMNQCTLCEKGFFDYANDYCCGRSDMCYECFKKTDEDLCNHLDKLEDITFFKLAASLGFTRIVKSDDESD